MKTNAIQLKGPGVDGIAASARDVPEVGSEQVLLRMGGSCLNYHDAVVIWGFIPGMRYPRIPLSDGCGTIVELGSAVAGFAPGDRVAANFYPSWHSGPPTILGKQPIPGEGVDGMCAEHVVVESSSLVRVPSHLSELEAGTLPCAAVTAWAALRDGDVAEGQTVVVQGTGGVSLFALQLAKARGARVILTSSSDEKLERGHTLGADEGINYRTHSEWSREVLRLTDGRGADIVVDVGGEGSLGQAVLATRMAGHVAIVGVLGGFGNAEVPVTVAMTRNIKMQGVTVGSRADFDAMCRFMEEKKIRPIVSDTFPMADLAGAVKHLEEGRHFGKIAIEVGS
ncbi:MAG: NAD(P)-dependent alcohol dehydrogenase [Candidatus Binatia bacterium]|nr:NAD(P)-dependent alcohol dehydrogenase [Candidatus Binatia bacterium]